MASTPPARIRIGARPSVLAQIQARQVADRFLRRFSDISIEQVAIESEGDLFVKDPISKIGGKGIFIKTLETALLDGRIDIAVHSFKDVTSQLPDELTLAGFLSPEAVCDAVVGSSLALLPPGAWVGTGSIRRITLIHQLYPWLKCRPIRGNVQTRVAAIQKEGLDAVVLSHAGLIRLDMADQVAEVLDPSTFTPAPGQGVVAIEARRGDAAICECIQAISDPAQIAISNLEFQLMAVLGFDCQIPFGVWSRYVSDVEMALSCFIAVPATSHVLRQTRYFNVDDQKSVLMWGYELKEWGIRHGLF